MTRFTRYEKASFYASPPAGEFGSPNNLLGTCDIEVADGAFESGGERNVFRMRFVRHTCFSSCVLDAQAMGMACSEIAHNLGTHDMTP